MSVVSPASSTVSKLFSGLMVGMPALNVMRSPVTLVREGAELNTVTCKSQGFIITLSVLAIRRHTLLVLSFSRHIQPALEAALVQHVRKSWWCQFNAGCPKCTYHVGVSSRQVAVRSLHGCGQRNDCGVDLLQLAQQALHDRLHASKLQQHAMSTAHHQHSTW